MSESAELKFDPGVYQCVIVHPSGQRLQAQVDLSAGREPRGEIYGWPLEAHDDVHTFPQPPERFPLLRCDLRRGLEVLLLDVTIEVWFPERARLRAELAVAGAATVGFAVDGRILGAVLMGTATLLNVVVIVGYARQQSRPRDKTAVQAGRAR